MHNKAETALRHEIYFNIGRKIIKEYRPKNKKGVRTEGYIFVLRAGMNARVTKCALIPCIGLPACIASVRRYARAAYRALLRR